MLAPYTQITHKTEGKVLVHITFVHFVLVIRGFPLSSGNYQGCFHLCSGLVQFGAAEYVSLIIPEECVFGFTAVIARIQFALVSFLSVYPSSILPARSVKTLHTSGQQVISQMSCTTDI